MQCMVNWFVFGDYQLSQYNYNDIDRLVNHLLTTKANTMPSYHYRITALQQVGCFYYQIGVNYQVVEYA